MPKSEKAILKSTDYTTNRKEEIHKRNWKKIRDKRNKNSGLT
jgi:hypothetical protein